MFFFSFALVLFELPPDQVEQWAFLDKVQDGLTRKCNFLVDLMGRGLSHVFVGTLWIGLIDNVVEDLLDIIAGIAELFIGWVYISMARGYGPAVIAKQMRGYLGISAPAEEAQKEGAPGAPAEGTGKAPETG